MKFETRFISSLEKVFCEQELPSEAIQSVLAARGETLSFQLALKSADTSFACWEIKDSGLPEIRIREAEVVPCMMPAVREDPYILRSDAGLYPDPLTDPVKNGIHLTPGNWHALWFSIDVPEDFKPGKYLQRIHLRNENDPLYSGCEYEAEVSLEIIISPAVLPKQKMKVINWFYADCLSTQYHTPCWSERHWELLGKYFRNMVCHGITHLLTPLWTVPLDTMRGGERPTAQLLEISYAKGVYTFDFSRLKRWIDSARAAGFEYFEMSHAFTQWGAEFTPKIVVRNECGEEEKRFGWHVRANSAEYRFFLEQLFPRLLDFLESEGLEGKCVFHASDEPTEKCLESYSYAANMLKRLLKGKYTLLDALSSMEFFRRGIVETPVPCTPEIEDFLKEDIAERWVYYCGNWQNGLPNRQFGMPSARNRILGVLLYYADLDGFLNWGYNFWYAQLSRSTDLNPWTDPCAERSFRGGGSFNVYPAKDGPADSIHYEVFREALQDHRLLTRLEEKLGSRQAVLDFLKQENGGTDLTFHEYPRDAAWLIRLHDKICAMTA